MFADLAGFTTLTRADRDEHAADLADEFSKTVGTWCGATRELVEMIGDAAMVRRDAAARRSSWVCGYGRSGVNV